MVTRRSRRAFPVALYATLLAALCCVASPGVPRAVQGWLQSVLCLPLRAWVNVGPGPGSADQAAEREASEAANDLLRRLERAALAGIGPRVPAGLEPVLCRVVERVGRGASGLPSTLYLDRSAEELADSEGFVTFGNDLLGFLAPFEPGPDAQSPQPARVDLLHGKDARGWARPVAAVVDAPAGPMRFVVEPASRIDRWPLRCRLFEEPYRASRLRHSGEPVRTTTLDGDPLGDVPPGLNLGSLQVWGYPGDAGGAQIGLFVRPDLDPRLISVVAVWRQRRELSESRLSRAPVAAEHGVSRLRLPAATPVDERWVLTVDAGRRLPTGGALVRGDMMFGAVEQSGPGFALASPFGGSRRLWSLLLLPDAPELAPVPLLVRSAGIPSRGSVRVLVEGGRVADIPGVLFTGANGPHCPLGLMIGRAERIDVDGLELAVDVALGDDGRLSVCVGREVSIP